LTLPIQVILDRLIATVLGHALNLLAGAALRLRERSGVQIAPWALIGFFAQGRLLAPPLIN
jgi:hypothetical protein